MTLLLAMMEQLIAHLSVLTLLVAVFFAIEADTLPNNAVVDRSKRQLPFGFGLFGGGGGAPFSPFGGLPSNPGIPSFGGPGSSFRPHLLGVLADNRKCCCAKGVPPECLEKCVIRPGAPATVLPDYCEHYEQIYGFDCFAGNDLKGECAPDYSQPPPRPQKCPAVLLQADDVLCLSDGCHTDHSCSNRPNAKCCRTTCPDRTANSNTGKMVCLEGVLGNLSPCELHRHRVLDQLIEANELIDRTTLEAWLPECTQRLVDPARPSGASYKSTQCVPGSRVCFCVNVTTGQEISSSRHSQDGRPINCTLLTSRQYSPCRREALLILEQHASLPMPELMHGVEQDSVWIPDCLKNSQVSDGQRSHRHLQCDTRSGYCWCTTHSGKAILDAIMPIGHPIFVSQCTDYKPTRCEREVADILHDYRIETYGLKNGSQHFQSRKFYERLPDFFVHRCARHTKSRSASKAAIAQHTYQKVQFTVRALDKLAERFCVNTKTGDEIEGSRLGAGEHRFVRSTGVTKSLCHKRSRCEDVVFQQLRVLHDEQLKRKAMGLRSLVNREMAWSLGLFLPACQSPSAMDVADSRPGQPLSGSLTNYGYAPRQCGAYNNTCWCVYRDGYPVAGTVHSDNETMDCSKYHSLCVLPDRIRVLAPTPVLRSAIHRCPSPQVCRDVGLHIGIGLCQVEEVTKAKICRVSGRVVLPGALTLIHGPCQLCRCQSGRLQACQQLPRSNCSTAQPCFVRAKNRRIIPLGDGMRSSVDCGDCVCRNGVISCVKRNCSLPEITPRVAHTCIQPEYAGEAGSMCAPNGRTYSHKAVAFKCAGFNEEEISVGSCPSQNPCRVSLCMSGYTCVPAPRQCIVAPCPQYICLMQNTTCDVNSGSNKACFNGNTSHATLCHGLATTQHAQYLGSCDRKCVGLICGTDKVTYESECHARASGVPVDYKGSCRGSCKAVQCPRLPRPCTVITHLPDQCCPFCGGGAQVSISKSIARALVGAGHDAGNDITSILSALQSVLKNLPAESCAVRGHVTSDDIMEVRVETLPGKESQGLACFQGVQTVISSINSGNLQQLSAVTAALTTANVQTARTGFSSAAPATATFNLALMVFVAYLATLLA